MTDKELLQQALDALTCAVPFGWSSNYVDKHRAATEALRERLAQPEPVATGFIRTLVEVGEDGIETWKNEPFYTAPPQQKTKIHDCPRCHCHFMDSGEILSQTIDGKSWRDNPQFPAKVGAQPEPVKCDGDFPEGFDASFGIPAQALRTANAIMFDVIGKREWDVPCTAQHLLTFIKNYTEPPKKEWVGLTDEEIGTLTVFYGLHYVEVPLLANFARAVEAKLKEKNT